MKKITVYTTSTCQSCVTVKRYLDRKGVNYQTINLDQQPDKQKEVFAKSGALTVPITLVQKEDNSEEIVIGPNLPRLASVVA